MTLPVPLTVRVGDHLVTKQVQSLSFRREAVGGVRSISFTLARSLTDLAGVEPLAPVYVYDARTAATVAQGRLADTGRGAGGDGQRWDCVAFGPAQHPTDAVGPLVYVDRRIGDDVWEYVDIVHASGTSFTAGTRPGDNTAAAPSGLLAAFAGGIDINAGSRIVRRYTPAWQAGHKLARYAFNWVTGDTSAVWQIHGRTRTDGSPSTGEDSFAAFWSTSGGTAAKVVGTDFPVGRNTLDLRIYWGGGAAVTGDDTNWGWFEAIVVRTMLVDKTGADITTGYTNNYVLASEVVADLLGRVLTEFDGPNATVAPTTINVDQLAYPEGVSAAQILEDLMVVEPAYRWYTTPDTTGNGYGFRWEQWPTTVRYEATLDDGGTFPLSAQAVYNRCIVKWTPVGGGAPRWTVRTRPCEILDNAGLVRTAVVDLGSEVGSSQLAETAGDAFLADHNFPKNSGTLTVARPIRDVITGAMVQPWEIEAGELVRIRGVEAYPDAFNANTNDGQGVFRIFAVDYNSEGNAATLALDSDPRETEDALVKLLNERSRR